MTEQEKVEKIIEIVETLNLSMNSICSLIVELGYIGDKRKKKDIKNIAGVVNGRNAETNGRSHGGYNGKNKASRLQGAKKAYKTTSV